LKESDEKPITITPLSEEISSDIVLDLIEVFQVLYNLDPNKASGPDNIAIRLLKECASTIVPSLTSLFNKSLQLGILPFEWKLSNIIPLHKKGDKSFVEHYRPISLCCCQSDGTMYLQPSNCPYPEPNIRCTTWICKREIMHRTAPLSLHRISENLDLGSKLTSCTSI
jgi:hypothetical protein